MSGWRRGVESGAPTTNTLRYRLKRIQDYSGQDPHTFAGLAELQCILEALAPRVG